MGEKKKQQSWGLEREDGEPLARWARRHYIPFSLNRPTAEKHQIIDWIQERNLPDLPLQFKYERFQLSFLGNASILEKLVKVIFWWLSLRTFMIGRSFIIWFSRLALMCLDVNLSFVWSCGWIYEKNKDFWVTSTRNLYLFYFTEK